MEAQTGIQRAVEMMGSPAKLADAVGHGVLRQHVEHWLKTGCVSAKQAPHVAGVTGIPLEKLNDQVPWDKVPKTLRQSKPALAKAV
jgi:DNA-binding transcriptional regulator YdaS (Cro superfamily)